MECVRELLSCGARVGLIYFFNFCDTARKFVLKSWPFLNDAFVCTSASSALPPEGRAV